MIAHVVPIVLGAPRFNDTANAKHLGSAAQQRLRQSFDTGSTTALWIDCYGRTLTDDVAILEMVCPNTVSKDRILTAINQAVRDVFPDLLNNQWEAIIFFSIHCENQDR